MRQTFLCVQAVCSHLDKMWGQDYRRLALMSGRKRRGEQGDLPALRGRRDTLSQGKPLWSCEVPLPAALRAETRGKCFDPCLKVTFERQSRKLRAESNITVPPFL